MDEPILASLNESPTPNPKRVAAGQRNRQLRGGLTEAGRTRLSEAALRNRPSQFSTGPTSDSGRQQSARNGKKRQAGELSAREFRVLFGYLIAHLGPLKNLRLPKHLADQLKKKKS